MSESYLEATANYFNENVRKCCLSDSFSPSDLNKMSKDVRCRRLDMF